MNKQKNKHKPHPHAELIKAWADGAVIQGLDQYDNQWRDYLDSPPLWDVNIQYRIKPEENEPWTPKNGEIYYYLNSIGEIEEQCFHYHWPCDDARLKLGNCFRTMKEAKAAIPRMERALKNLYAISDKKAHDLECELYDKIDRLTKYPEIDGNPLSDGEKALIRAFRNGRLCRQFFGANSIIVEGHDNVPKGVAVHREFVAFFMHSPMQNGEVRNALEQIQAEQEAQNEAK